MLRFLMELLREWLVVTRPISDRILNWVYRLVLGKQGPLPPIDNKILLMPAVVLAEKIRKRLLSCEEVMRVYVERSREVHPFLNAVVDERYEAALREAREVDALLARGGRSEEEISKATPLLGVPFTCKEFIGVKGMAQTCGMISAKDHVASKDSDAAALYRKAGAIPYVVSNVPELCMWWETANVIFGRTINPYDSTRSPGGSSGGEGVVLGSAAGVIGIGNDLSGSIRLPCSFNGIYGHKPSRGVISNKGLYPEDNMLLDEMASTGPMCRYAQDLPLLCRILSGNDKRVRWQAKVDFKSVNVYFMEELPGLFNGSTSDIREAIRKAVKHFDDEYGCRASRAKVPELRDACDLWEARLLSVKGDATLQSAMSPPGGRVNLHWELVKKLLFRCSDFTLPAIFFALVERKDSRDRRHKNDLKKFRQLEKALEQLLEGDAILLLPTQPEPPPHYLMTIPKFKNLGYTGVFNALGFPVTQIPAGLSSGLPIGIQAVARLHQDHLTIAAALELDKVFGGWQSPCPVTAR